MKPRIKGKPFKRGWLPCRPFAVVPPALFLFILLISLPACKFKRARISEDRFRGLTDTITFSSFKQVQRVTFIKTGLNVGTWINGMVTSDTFLILSDLRKFKLLSLVSLRSNKLIGEVINRGKEKGECLDVANILTTSDSRKIWLYDITLVKFMQVDLAKAARDSNYLPEREISPPDTPRAVKSPCWINDSLFAGCSYFMDDCRFIKFDDHFKPVQKIGVLPPPLDDWPEENKPGSVGLLASCYSANLLKRPASDAYAVACTKTSRIDFYDGDRLKRIVRGPGLFQPIYKFGDFDGVHVPAPNGKTTSAFSAVSCDDQFVYMIYSGKDNFLATGQQILVFDWQGDPVKIIELGSDYQLFAISSVKGEFQIHTVDPVSGDLMVARIDNALAKRN